MAFAHTRADMMTATQAEWQALNPVVRKRIFAVSSDTGEIRLGNGTDHWADLFVHATSSSEAQLFVPVAGGTMSGDLTVPDNAYDATNWNASLKVPTRNSIRNQIETHKTDAATHTNLPYETVRTIDAKISYGADSTGSANASTAIQNAINAASTAGGGTVYLPAGTYKISAALVPKNRVSIVGAGWGRTVLRPQGTVSAIDGATGGPYTSGSPLTNCVFSDFEIDGSDQTGTGVSYSASIKGIYVQWHRNCHYRNLYIHDTIASGLGVDFFLGGSLITGCLVTGCGRGNDGTQPGGNGIGVGVASSGADDEPLTISGNWVTGNTRSGILLEAQTDAASTNDTRGARIENNYCATNQSGIHEGGGRFSVILGNTCAYNVVNGSLTGSGCGIVLGYGSFSIARPGYEPLIEGNHCYYNQGDGILFNYYNSDVNANVPKGHVMCRANYCSYNTKRGIALMASSLTVDGVSIDGNTSHTNGLSGIRTLYVAGHASSGALQHSRITNNHCFNNGTAGTSGDKDGIRIDTLCNDVAVDDNFCFDDQGSPTQGYGVVINNTYVRGSLKSNYAHNNTTGSFNVGSNLSTTQSTATWVGSNRGMIPAGPTSVSNFTGTGPYAWTAPSVPTVLNLTGNVTAVTVNTTAAGSGPGQYLLEPADAVSITTSSGAPTGFWRSRA